MRRFKQKSFRVGNIIRANIFSVPTKDFNNSGIRLSIDIGHLSILITWK